jgi:glycosyltransferase involved in cell wall biosynthesis
MLPTVSIIIPTYNSEKVIGLCLKAARNQNYPKDRFEIIVADNYSKDKTVSISKSLGAKVFLLEGVAPQGCAQRNLGAEKSKSEYLFFLDHDMEMSRNLLMNFAERVMETNCEVDAWYVPEEIIGNGPLWTQIRTFERGFYNSTVVDAARIIRKETFEITEKYDPKLSSGPADWDMDIQLREAGCKFGIIDECVYHHEEHMSLWKYLTKKSKYANGSLMYQEKWRKRSKKVYNETIRKQYSARYRLIGVFFENGKWKKAAEVFHMYIALLLIRLFVGIVYYKEMNLGIR